MKWVQRSYTLELCQREEASESSQSLVSREKVGIR